LRRTIRRLGHARVLRIGDCAMQHNHIGGRKGNL
jgi:hypothetical protein